MDWHRPRIATLLGAGVDLLAIETLPALVRGGEGGRCPGDGEGGRCPGDGEGMRCPGEGEGMMCPGEG